MTEQKFSAESINPAFSPGSIRNLLGEITKRHAGWREEVKANANAQRIKFLNTLRKSAGVDSLPDDVRGVAIKIFDRKFGITNHSVGAGPGWLPELNTTLWGARLSAWATGSQQAVMDQVNAGKAKFESMFGTTAHVTTTHYFFSAPLSAPAKAAVTSKPSPPAPAPVVSPLPVAPARSSSAPAGELATAAARARAAATRAAVPIPPAPPKPAASSVPTAGSSSPSSATKIHHMFYAGRHATALVADGLSAGMVGLPAVLYTVEKVVAPILPAKASDALRWAVDRVANERAKIGDIEWMGGYFACNVVARLMTPGFGWWALPAAIKNTGVYAGSYFAHKWSDKYLGSVVAHNAHKIDKPAEQISCLQPMAVSSAVGALGGVLYFGRLGVIMSAATQASITGLRCFGPNQLKAEQSFGALPYIINGVVLGCTLYAAPPAAAFKLALTASTAVAMSDEASKLVLNSLVPYFPQLKVWDDVLTKHARSAATAAGAAMVRWEKNGKAMLASMSLPGIERDAHVGKGKAATPHCFFGAPAPVMPLTAAEATAKAAAKWARCGVGGGTARTSVVVAPAVSVPFTTSVRYTTALAAHSLSSGMEGISSAFYTATHIVAPILPAKASKVLQHAVNHVENERAKMGDAEWLGGHLTCNLGAWLMMPRVGLLAFPSVIASSGVYALSYAAHKKSDEYLSSAVAYNANNIDKPARRVSFSRLVAVSAVEGFASGYLSFGLRGAMKFAAIKSAITGLQLHDQSLPSTAQHFVAVPYIVDAAVLAYTLWVAVPAAAAAVAAAPTTVLAVTAAASAAVARLVLTTSAAVAMSDQFSKSTIKALVSYFPQLEAADKFLTEHYRSVAQSFVEAGKADPGVLEGMMDTIQRFGDGVNFAFDRAEQAYTWCEANDQCSYASAQALSFAGKVVTLPFTVASGAVGAASEAWSFVKSEANKAYAHCEQSKQCKEWLVAGISDMARAQEKAATWVGKAWNAADNAANQVDVWCDEVVAYFGTEVPQLMRERALEDPSAEITAGDVTSETWTGFMSGILGNFQDGNVTSQ